MTEPQLGDPDPVEEQQPEGAEKHPLMIWTGLNTGDLVSLRALDGQDCVGIVESRTSDGLIVWIRDDLNKKRLFHFRDCLSVHVVQQEVARGK